MEPFSFEHKFQFDEKTYTDLNSLFKKDSKNLRYALFILIAVCMLYSKYTIVLGVSLLLFSCIRFFAPRLLKLGIHSIFSEVKYIKEELTYGINEKQLWVYASHLKVNLDWEYAKVWDEQAGWLRISSDHCPTFWFRVSDLKNKGIYEKVISLCEKYAVKYK
ncbi:hypothetical protein [Desulfosediminicola flagellatus]|uniref:hypothetical protein n=1 Tax=Desulfosediminicola flagellatus TaxID=2569541 RepID=UPI0010AB656C|nr:hypothetical protein [Desulfosediminicola flagellatus]